MKGEVAQVKEEMLKKPAAKSMREMLRETAISRRISLGSTCALVYNTAIGRAFCDALYTPDISQIVYICLWASANILSILQH